MFVITHGVCKEKDKNMCDVKSVLSGIRDDIKNKKFITDDEEVKNILQKVRDNLSKSALYNGKYRLELNLRSSELPIGTTKQYADKAAYLLKLEDPNWNVIVNYESPDRDSDGYCCLILEFQL